MCLSDCVLPRRKTEIKTSVETICHLDLDQELGR